MQIFETLGIINDIHPGMKVVLKPNLVMAKSHSFP